jgi:predicted membrane channel-forming protein YqfA (hemolysin III family)
MKGPARYFFTLAVIYAILGILLGLQMAISEDHGEKVTHAHIMLAGWVSMALFGFFYHLFPAINGKAIAMVHFWLQAAASVVMLGSLFLVYGGNPAVEPGAAIGAISYGLGVLLFAYISLPAIWKS